MHDPPEQLVYIGGNFWLSTEKALLGVSQLGEVENQGASTNQNFIGGNNIIRIKL